ncbi:MAG: hypothetical protein P4L84_00030 [Isosphaeraceae bacterium]|nr:hypothetical protein [Isosphaeraceae bacterium]
MVPQRGSLARRQPATFGSARRPAMGCEVLEGRSLLSSVKQDVLQLVRDLNGLHQSSNVILAEVQAVTADLKAIGQVATKPAPSTVAALKAEVRVVIADGTITPAEAVALEKDVSAVLASANVPSSLAQQTASDIHAVITSSGISKQDVNTILGDVEAILTDLGSMKK